MPVIAREPPLTLTFGQRRSSDTPLSCRRLPRRFEKRAGQFVGCSKEQGDEGVATWVVRLSASCGLLEGDRSPPPSLGLTAPPTSRCGVLGRRHGAAIATFLRPCIARRGTPQTEAGVRSWPPKKGGEKGEGRKDVGSLDPADLAAELHRTRRSQGRFRPTPEGLTASGAVRKIAVTSAGGSVSKRRGRCLALRPASTSQRGGAPWPTRRSAAIRLSPRRRR